VSDLVDLAATSPTTVTGAIPGRRREGPERLGPACRGDEAAGGADVRCLPGSVYRRLRPVDASNADDRILASVLEVMRRFPRRPVALVTRDLELQHKAEFARIPYVEPPEPVGTSA
jgi:hypothetical protein